MTAAPSLAGRVAALPTHHREALLSDLNADELVALEADWRFWARPAQLPPAGEWTFWLLLGGRGSGKTWVGANWSHEQAERMRGSIGHLVAPTSHDLRATMLEGPAGILATARPDFRPQYEPSKHKLTWPNGSTCLLFSADEPERLRGPQCHWCWADELAAWRYPAAWDMLLFGLRLGDHPQGVVTTTPRPVPILTDLMKRADSVQSRMRTADNLANLAPVFLSTVVAPYQGTRLGRQELDAELLEDVPGALWTRDLIDRHRVSEEPDLVRIVVAIDPAAKSREDSNKTGIVAAGVGTDGHAYVLADRSDRLPPVAGEGREGWANVAVALYRRLRADRILAETNNGGEMVEATLRIVDPTIAYTEVSASRGKMRRAEPIAALYEQGRVHHVGSYPELEDQMCGYVPSMAENASQSPDRMDALVWALTDLMIRPAFFFV